MKANIEKRNGPRSTDVLLVGAGPIGLEVAFFLKEAGIDYFHVEAGNVGSTIQWYAPGTAFFSSPERLSIARVPFVPSSHTKGTREEYLSYLRAVASQHSLKVVAFTKVVAAIRLSSGLFECMLTPSIGGIGGPDWMQIRDAVTKSLSANYPILAKRIVLAVGDMHLPREVNVPGESLPGVSHYFTEPHQCYRQKVVIVGAKNSAAEAIVRLSRVEADVTVCHRGVDFDSERIKPWLLPEIRCLVSEGRVKVIPSVVVERIEQGTVKLKSLASQGVEEIIEVDYQRLFLLTGYRQENALFRSLGVELMGESASPVHDSQTMETNVPGVYVAGTAVAGTQLGGAKVFIENCHVHATKIVNAILGNSRHVDVSDRPVESREL